MVFLGKGRTVAGVLVACLAVLSRPDAGFLALALIAWAALFAPGHRLPIKRAAALGAAVLVVSIAIPTLLGGTGRRLPPFYFESRLYELARMHETISLAGYWAAFVKNLSGKGLYYRV